jgi:predicted pyridoxine 5'-phosphate oxidase superfamily flavin-nucleotide-binding protein
MPEQLYIKAPPRGRASRSTAVDEGAVMRTGSRSRDLVFTPSIKAIQARKGSRQLYRRMDETRAWAVGIPPDLAAFIAAQTSMFIATASAHSQPYIQHRGGPPGFLRVLDDKTIGFTDFVGNRQYVTQGNLAENPRVCLFLIDYAQRRRIKIWGEARVVEGDAELTAKLMPPGYRARPEQNVLVTVSAWEANCPQHIPQLFAAADVANLVERIASLEAEIGCLRAAAAANLGS